MNVTKIFLTYSIGDAQISEFLAEELNKYAVYTVKSDDHPGSVIELIDIPEIIVDGYVFLISYKSLQLRDYEMSLRHAIKMCQSREKFLIPIVLGEIPVPSYLRSVPFFIFKEDYSINKAVKKIAEVIDSWVQNDVFQSGESLPAEQDKFLKNLFVNLNGVASPKHLNEFPYLIDWIQEFHEMTQINRKVSNSIIGQRIRKRVLLLEGDKRSMKSDYYFLKINAATWITSELVPGKISRFHSHDLQGNRRVDYELFTNLKFGDLLIGYVFQEYNAVLCVFNIIQSLNIDQQHGEGVSLSVLKEINPPIPLVYFKDKIDFYEKLGPDNPERLFKISKSLFDSIIESKVISKRTEPKHDIEASFSGDMDFESTHDQLDFQNDINSFASIITLKKIKPPLAIGLFGEWGAGKSFFMEKLSQQIDKLSVEKSNKYVKNVVQVKFNAWHYSDGNLWASLVTHIFEELNNFAHKGNFDENSVKDLYAKLDLTSIAITENEDQIAIVGGQLNDIEAKKNELEEIIKDKKLKLTMLSNHDIMGVIFKDPSIQAVVKSIQKDEPTSQLISNLEDIDGKLDEYNNFFKRILEAYSLFKKSGKWWKVWMALFFMIVGAFCFFFPPFKEKINSVLFRFTSFTAAFIAFLSGFEWLKPHLKTVEKYYNRLKRLKDSIQTKADQLEYTETNEIQKLESEIDRISQKESALNKELEDKKHEKERLQGRIDDIGTGRMIANFLAGKSNEDSYNSELGIISRIRKDFTQLNKLFKQQDDVNDKKYNKGERFQIDRIILYIDDLDRCNSDIVTKTLEAVHLLLAFELFVVVVGVDSRWLKSSLLEKYSYFSDDNENAVSQITSFDYLEKIFQIPFTIKAVTNNGRNKLINYLTDLDLEQTKLIDESEKQKIPSEKSIEIDGLLKENGIKENLTFNDDKSLVSMDMIDNVDISDEFELETQERITLSSEEILAMQNISFLYGNTPRKIKRYVNIYRIIKAHRNYSISTIYSKNDYLPTMVSLAIVVGFPEFIKDMKVVLQKDSILGFDELLEFVTLDKLKLLLQELPQEIKSTINSSSLSENFDLISRFSFRTN